MEMYSHLNLVVADFAHSRPSDEEHGYQNYRLEM